MPPSNHSIAVYLVYSFSCHLQRRQFDIPDHGGKKSTACRNSTTEYVPIRKRGEKGAKAKKVGVTLLYLHFSFFTYLHYIYTCKYTVNM